MKNYIIHFQIILLFSNIEIVMGQNAIKNTMLYAPDNASIRYSGRIDFENPRQPKLISAGSYFTFDFTGSTCAIQLENEQEGNGFNFIAVECDGKYLGRIKVVKDQKKYVLVSGLEDTHHTILVCKATEALTGFIELLGIECENIALPGTKPNYRIEFIGNSITCGAESDISEYLCNSGNWQDRHNAYLAYGPRIARSLNAEWVLSSVSGMGLTRNWNTEGPALPAFYDNLYLNSDSSKKWTGADYNPGLVTICLGTNDNSDGDGSYDRKPLDPVKFVNEYIRFVKHIRQRYPLSIICLINSPVFDGELRLRFQSYLESTVNSLKNETGDQKIFYFSFQKKYEGGCGGHPSADEHLLMADELLPFLKKITGW
jgi:lysophospholipase L1-like esterase